MQYGFGTSLKGNRCASEMVNCRDLTSLNLATLGARTICVTHIGLSTEIKRSILIKRVHFFILVLPRDSNKWVAKIHIFQMIFLANTSHIIESAKGQVISKANCQAVNSSKKWTNEFIFTRMECAFVCFLEEIEDCKKAFRNYLTFTVWAS